MNLPVGDVDIVYCFCLVSCQFRVQQRALYNVSFVYGSRSPAYVLLLPTACAWFNWFYLVIIAFLYNADLCKLK